MEKVCSKCGEKKPLSSFGKNKAMNDSLTVWCKDCITEYRREYKENNPEKFDREKKKEVNRLAYESRSNKVDSQVTKPLIDANIKDVSKVSVLSFLKLKIKLWLLRGL